MTCNDTDPLTLRIHPRKRVPLTAKPLPRARAADILAHRRMPLDTVRLRRELDARMPGLTIIVATPPLRRARSAVRRRGERTEDMRRGQAMLLDVQLAARRGVQREPSWSA